MYDDNLKKLDKGFKKLIDHNKINISAIEDLLSTNIEEYKTKAILRIEELLDTKIDEKELIIKKNFNGKKKDIN